jgi:hypothetical protein
MTTGRMAQVAVILALLWAPKAWGFDFARYQATDLDELMQQKRPQTGVDLHPARPLKLRIVDPEY